MKSQLLGFIFDAYDMAFALVMAPILIKGFVSPKGSAAWQYTTIAVIQAQDRLPSVGRKLTAISL